MRKKLPSGRHLTIAVFMAGMVFGANATHANPRHSTAVIEAPAAKAKNRRTAAGNGSARYDWLAPMRQTAPLRQASNRGRLVRPGRSLGSGSWICSPAGFGKKSHCYRR